MLHSQGKRPRLILLSLLLIPCWVVGLNFFVDLKVIHFVINLPTDRLREVYSGFADGGGRFFYGPISLVLLKPLAGLSPRALQIVWLVLQTSSYVLFWWGLSRLYPSLLRADRLAAWIFVWVMAINPIHNNFQSNNIQLMLMACLVWADIYSRSSGFLRQFLAGLLTTLAAAIKIFPALIVVFYFVARPRATKLGQIAGILLFGGIPFLVFGGTPTLDLYAGIVRNLTTYHADNPLTTVPDILCLPSMLTRLLSGYASAETIRYVVWGSLALGILVLLSIAKRFPKDRVTWAFALTLMTLLNPSTRVHYFIFLVPAFCSLVEASGLPERFLLFISAGLLALTTEFVVGKATNDWLEISSVPTWGMIVLTLALVLPLLRGGFPSQREIVVGELT